jgi:hypothetical protein
MITNNVLDIDTRVRWGRFLGTVTLVVYNWDDTVHTVMVRWDSLPKVPKVYTGMEADCYFTVMQEDLTPELRPFACAVASAHDDLWERFVSACEAGR